MQRILITGIHGFVDTNFLPVRVPAEADIWRWWSQTWRRSARRIPKRFDCKSAEEYNNELTAQAKASPRLRNIPASGYSRESEERFGDIMNSKTFCFYQFHTKKYE